jgi:plastocyanin
MPTVSKRSICFSLLAAAVSAVAFAAPASAQDSSPAAIVDMTFGLKFEPDTVRIRVGQTVEWRNKAFFAHTVTFDPGQADDPAHVSLPAGVAPFDSGKIGGGKTWRHTFTVAGTYHYICKPHEGHDMLGTVIVSP